MEENIQGCTGHCEKCSVNQRTYCAAQRSYFLEQEIIEIKSMLRQKDVDEIATIRSRSMSVTSENILNENNLEA